MKVFSKAMGSPPLQWLIRERNSFVKILMKRSLRTRLSDKEFAHYTDVVPTPESRKGIAVFPKQILDASRWLSDLENRVGENLGDKPVVLMFGRKDPALASDAIINRWRREFPDARVIDLPDAGHYIQEDAPNDIANAIKAVFLG